MNSPRVLRSRCVYMRIQVGVGNKRKHCSTCSTSMYHQQRKEETTKHDYSHENTKLESGLNSRFNSRSLDLRYGMKQITDVNIIIRYVVCCMLLCCCIILCTLYLVGIKASITSPFLLRFISLPIFSTPNPTSSVGFIKVRFYTINYFKLRCMHRYIFTLWTRSNGTSNSFLLQNTPKCRSNGSRIEDICIPTTNIDFKRISNEYINSFYSSSYSTPCPGFKSSHEY